MEFTQEQLESMSDFELNVVAANNFYDSGEITTSPAKFGVQVHVNGAFVDGSYNPCGSWSNCGDLIDEFKIGLDPVNLGGEVEWFVRTEFSNEMLAMGKNPKRAVTIVYILVKQEQACNKLSQKL